MRDIDVDPVPQPIRVRNEPARLSRIRETASGNRTGYPAFDQHSVAGDAMRFAALDSHSMTRLGAARYIFQLQRLCGNRYVQRVMVLAHRKSEQHRSAEARFSRRSVGETAPSDWMLQREDPTTSSIANAAVGEHRMVQPGANLEPIERNSSPAESLHEAQSGAQNGVMPHALEAVAAASSSVGEHLPPKLGGRFEQALGVDLSSVRIHTGVQSARASRVISARAFTVGQDIHFGEREYNPETFEGQHLLAHEVAHTVQQSGRPPVASKVLAVSQPDDSFEVDADRTADAILKGQTVSTDKPNSQGEFVLADQPAAGISRDYADRPLQREPGPEVTANAPVRNPAKPPGQTESQKDVIQSSLTPEDQIRDSLDVVQGNFHWISEKVGPRIQELKSDLLEEDKPSWSEFLVESLVDVALLAGAASFGELMAAKYVAEFLKEAVKNKTVTENVAEAGHEFAKALIEQGTGKGIETGRKAASGGNDKDLIPKFISSQSEGATDMYKADHDHFVHVGRHLIKTVEEAKALEEASNQLYEAAPEIQYKQARDAWVSYLAQKKFGQYGKHTDMSPPWRRNQSDDANVFGSPAPDMGTAFMHGSRDQGVLYVTAELPEIKSDFNFGMETDKRHMNGKPEVKLAILNGVNDKIREQYRNQHLSQIHIPRQIVAKVEGATPNFTVDLDETGQSFNHEKGITSTLGQEPTAWLMDRARVADAATPSNENGLKLLLNDLVTEEIKKGMG